MSAEFFMLLKTLRRRDGDAEDAVPRVWQSTYRVSSVDCVHCCTDFVNALAVLSISRRTRAAVVRARNALSILKCSVSDARSWMEPLNVPVLIDSENTDLFVFFRHSRCQQKCLQAWWWICTRSKTGAREALARAGLQRREARRCR